MRLIMEFAREELIQHEAVMNQMRNAIYYLARFMQKNGISELKERLRRMGRNIAQTYQKFWFPANIVTTNNIGDVLATIYKKIFNSSIYLEFNNEKKTIKVKDSKCSLCKYQYDDIQIAGCEIILGLVSEFISIINKDLNDPSAVFLEQIEVNESFSYGNKQCVHIFKYTIGKK